MYMHDYDVQQGGSSAARLQTQYRGHAESLQGNNRQCTSKFFIRCRVTVKSLTAGTNVPLLAKEIVEKCKLIHPSKVIQVATPHLRIYYSPWVTMEGIEPPL
jgi:hypothetical protein